MIVTLRPERPLVLGVDGPVIHVRPALRLEVAQHDAVRAAPLSVWCRMPSALGLVPTLVVEAQPLVFEADLQVVRAAEQVRDELRQVADLSA